MRKRNLTEFSRMGGQKMFFSGKRIRCTGGVFAGSGHTQVDPAGPRLALRAAATFLFQQKLVSVERS